MHAPLRVNYRFSSIVPRHLLSEYLWTPRVHLL